MNSFNIPIPIDDGADTDDNNDRAQTPVANQQNNDTNNTIITPGGSGSKLASKFLLQSDLAKMERPELIRHLTNLEIKINKIDEMNVDLRAKLLSVTEERDLLRKKTNDALTGEKLQQIQEQIMQKDSRVMELNNVILEKERQIIDLQEMCSEQGKVAQSKSLAFGIMNRKLREFDAKQKRDASTETDFNEYSRGRNRSASPRRNSPGRAIPQFRMGNGSPPPIDPAEDGCSSYTTETMNNEGNDTTSKSKKFRKKVTFDVDNAEENARSGEQAIRPARRREQPAPPNAAAIATFDYEEMLIENDHLRQVISEMEKTIQSQQQQQNMGDMKTTAKSESLQILKTKAAAQAQIKKLEGMIGENKQRADIEIAELKAMVEQINESREWILNENAKIQDQLSIAQQKCDDLHEELDASLNTTDLFRKKLDDSARRLDATMTECYQSRALVLQASDEKAIMGSEVERLKEAIFAQDEFISLLEGDLIVYEAHVGILRDSLGASKKEDRQHIKSKAFSAKISALESEKQEIAKKNNEEKLRAKALTIKLRYLEEERDALKGKLRHYERQEMAGNDSVNANAETQIQMPTSPMIPDESNCLKLNEMEEQIALKTAQIESLIGQSQHLEQQIRQISILLEMTSSIVNRIFQSFVQEPNENNENSFTAVEDLHSKLELIQRKLVQNSEEIKAMHQSRNALFEELNTTQNQISEMTANLAHTIEANQKAELELQKLGDQHEQALNKITQNEQMISSFERRNVDLTMEISRNKASLESLEAERNMLADEKLSLENSIESMGLQIDNLHTINEKLQENLRATNAQSELLSAQLAEQKRRQEKLITILSETVNRFKEGTILDATFSDASLDQFIARMGGIGSAATQCNNENDNGASAIPNAQQNLPEIPSHQTQQEPTPILSKMEESENRAMRPFSKSVYVQVNLPSADVKEEEEMARRRNLELEELRRNLAEEHEQKISANFEVEAIRKKLIENEESLKQIVTQKEELVAERDDLYDQLTVQRELLEKERENIRNLPLKNAKEEEEIARIEMAQLQRSLAEEKKRKMSAEYEVETIQNKLIETEENLKEIVTQKEELAAERNDLYDQLTVQRELLEKELENAQGVHSILVEQFNELRHKVDEFEHKEREKAEQRENAMDYFVETHTQTETPMTNDQFVQPDKMECYEKIVQTEAEKNDPPNAITQTDQIELFMSKTQAEEEKKNIREIHHAQNQSAAEVCMIRQESHQLLMDCIQDREEFERHLGDNVQQLMELKSELESSVDVLKGEIWSLNLELKKRFNERDCLKGRVHELEEQIAHYKTQNDELLGGIQAKNGEMADLKEMLERSMENGRQIQTKFEESHSLLAEKTRKSDVLLARLKQILLDNPRGAIPGLRAELEQLKELQYQWRRETGESLQAFSANVLQQFNAAKFTTQKCDNGALIRENAELIEMNARLQTELNQMVSLQQGNIGPHNGNQSIRQMDEVLAEAELNVQIERDADDSLQNGGANDELAKAEIIMPLQMKMALEVDIDLGSIIGEEQRKDEEKWQDGVGDEANDENKKDLQRIEDEDAVAQDGFEIGMMNEEEVMKLDATKMDEEGNEALKTEERKSDEEEEASNDMEEEETKTTEDWNWNDAEEEEEEEEETTMGDEGEAEMKDEGHHEKQTLKIEIEEVPKAVKQDANAEDWNWSEDDGDEEDEEEEKQQPKRINDDKHPQAATDGNADKTGHTAAHIGSIEPKGKNFGQQPKTDEWAWNEDEDDDENDEEDDDDDKVINSGNSGSKSKPEQSNVKQLFEDW